VLSPDLIEEGSDVLVYIDPRRKWVTRVVKGKVFGSDRGTFRMDDVIGKPFGTSVNTSMNVRAYVLKPLLIDYIERGFERRTQVIYPKDAGFIALILGIGPGSRVLEAGIGSGFMCSVIANIVRPNGKVYAYEIRPEFAEIARKNLARLGLDKYVEIKIRDLREGVDEKDLDAAILDLPDPWDVLDVVYRALKPSAPAVFFLPTVSQVEKLLEAIERHGGFVDARCFEILLREYQLVRGAIRPHTTMVGHTGYIMFVRKVLKD